MNVDRNSLINSCSLSGVKPVVLPLPYPAVKVQEKNQEYAEILCMDYCGAVSELSAITQYINNETRFSGENCTLARILLGIAMAEMMHLQKLGELILLLGGEIDYSVQQCGRRRSMWSPMYLTLHKDEKRILTAGIDSEKAAINQYRTHMKMIRDSDINAVLARIIQDEEYHIMILQNLLNEMK